MSLIKTSYFGKISKIKYPLSICLNPPTWYKGPQYKDLAPQRDFLDSYNKGHISEEEYTSLYKGIILTKLSQEKVIKDIRAFYPEADEITLLCYEKPEFFCHRHLVADWLNTSGLIKVDESDI